LNYNKIRINRYFTFEILNVSTIEMLSKFKFKTIKNKTVNILKCL